MMQREMRAQTIAELKEKLAKLREESVMKTRMLAKETAARLSAQERVHNQRLRYIWLHRLVMFMTCRELENELATLTKKMEIETAVSGKTVDYLSRKNDQMVCEVLMPVFSDSCSPRSSLTGKRS